MPEGIVGGGGSLHSLPEKIGVESCEAFGGEHAGGRVRFPFGAGETQKEKKEEERFARIHCGKDTILAGRMQG